MYIHGGRGGGGGQFGVTGGGWLPLPSFLRHCGRNKGFEGYHNGRLLSLSLLFFLLLLLSSSTN